MAVSEPPKAPLWPGALPTPVAMSLLCPIDFRYGRPKMRGLFEEDARLQRLLGVEAALARAEAKVGLIPKEAALEITKKATTKSVTVKRVEELEKDTRTAKPPCQSRSG